VDVGHGGMDLAEVEEVADMTGVEVMTVEAMTVEVMEEGIREDRRCS